MIYLGSDEIKYMLMMLQLTPDLRQVLERIASSGGKVDEDHADELRDLCNDQLDICGYDESYKLNDDGKKLELLTDKLYIR